MTTVSLVKGTGLPVFGSLCGRALWGGEGEFGGLATASLLAALVFGGTV
jgi:hypothetical protein